MFTFAEKILCIDIGSAYIKLIYGRFLFGKLRVYKYGLIETPKYSYKNGYINNISLMAGKIKEFVHDKRIKANKVSYVIHSSDILIRNLEVPRLDKRNLRNTIEWEMDQYIKGSIKDYNLSYELRRKNDRVYSVLGVIAPRTIINQYEELSKVLKLKIKYIDIAAKCNLRLYRSVSQEFIAVDIGKDSTRVAIFSNGYIFAERELASRISHINQLAYEEYAAAVEKGLKPNNKVNLNNIFKQFDKIVKYYLSLESKGKLPEVYLNGGNSNLEEFKEYLKENYKGQLIIRDFPGNKCILSDQAFKDDMAFYINTLGLLMRK